MKSDLLLFLGRLLLAVFFVAEAFDKIRRFQEWSDFIAEAGLPFPAAEMVLIIALLILGSASLISGWKIQIGAVLLIVFLVPTALLFEPAGSAIKSISLLGALCIIIATGPGRITLGASSSETPINNSQSVPAKKA